MMRKKAELITRISLLKRKIDQCLDERDRQGFYHLSLELKVCQHYLETCTTNHEVRYKRGFEQKRGNFLNS
ncbi:IDEAL domain-containing protein [Neobacillus niacini]|uniref:IDEAL domain-containing protein n=1 Tax=Neobacillus niacini TaxID=86668 RepID=UPI003B58A055